MIPASHVISARAELGRRNLADYASMVEIPTAPADDRLDSFGTIPPHDLASHHKLLCDSLQDVADSRIQNLMVFMPPGSAKSTYVDVVFVPWYLSKYAKKSIILASYGSDLARKQGRRARALLKSRGHKLIFPHVSLSTESSAADEWALSNGSEYMAGGLLSGLTGNRADIGIIDDPVAGRSEADSETVSNTTWEAYKDDFVTRVKPGGRQIIIQTRWSENDISGRILPENWAGESGDILCRDGRMWRVICLPAKCIGKNDPLSRKPGEYLWPEWFPASHWAPMEGDRTPSGRRAWNSLYQQTPAPDEGAYFERAWFRRFKDSTYIPVVTKYITSDHAPGGTENNDYTCVRVWGVDRMGDIWLLDGYRAQETMDNTAQRLLFYIQRYEPACWFPENDNNYKSVAGFIWRMMLEQRIHTRIEPISPHGADKQAKAQAFQGMASMGRVHIAEGPEGDDIISEYLKFPGGRHDDEVDAAGIIGRALAMAHPALHSGYDEAQDDDYDIEHAHKTRDAVTGY